MYRATYPTLGKGSLFFKHAWKADISVPRRDIWFSFVFGGASIQNLLQDSYIMLHIHLERSLAIGHWLAMANPSFCISELPKQRTGFQVYSRRIRRSILIRVDFFWLTWGPINPYYWVDDHPLLYWNIGSLDPIAHMCIDNWTRKNVQKITHTNYINCIDPVHVMYRLEPVEILGSLENKGIHTDSWTDLPPPKRSNLLREKLLMRGTMPYAHDSLLGPTCFTQNVSL